ncbi:MAG: hypothetical protein COB36_14030 [Alphaproteobacteria bacterium]|nr:MAG: hypothetical protein COB36_14030 [Alphaproteobacteria bacterium]
MIIKSTIYENLKPEQRLVASIEALARHDDVEHEKLVQSCPQKTYKGADYSYSGTLQGLVSMSLSVEYDIMREALSMVAVMSARSDYVDEVVEGCMQAISNIRTAWSEALKEIGIDVESMDKLSQGVRHPIIDKILNEELPEANVVAVQERKKGMDSFFKKLKSV